MKTRTAVLMAMRDEAAPLAAALNMRKAGALDPRLPIEVFLSEDEALVIAVHGLDPVFHVDAIGTQPAAVAATLVLREYDPELVISAGTAGAFRKNGAAIGDVYLSRKIAFHDRRIALPGFDKYGMCLIETPEAAPVAAKLGFKLGNVTTGNSLDLPEGDLKTIQAWGGEIKDMEAASVAWIARLYGKKVFAVKAVTDLMDAGRPTEEEFLENLHMASAKLKDAMVRILSGSRGNS